MAVPYTFGNATTSIPLSQLDTNFATAITIGNTAVYLGNTTTTFGNVTLNNVTINSGNSTVTKETVTTITSPAATALTIQSAGTTAMTIDTSQNVGIGTTSPSNFGSTSKVLQVQSVDATGYGSLLVGSGTKTFEVLVNSNSGILTAGSRSNDPFALVTNDTERMRIDSSGNLLVGTTSANGRLSVDGAGATSATYAVYVRNSTPSDLFYLRNDGFFSTGGASSSPYNATTATAANVVVASNGQLQRSTSSLKYKTDIKNATHGLAEVLQLRPVTYKGKNDGETVFGGLIAEEVDAVGLTEFVQYAEDGSPDALAYGNMVSLLVKAIQELKAELDALKGTK